MHLDKSGPLSLQIVWIVSVHTTRPLLSQSSTNPSSVKVFSCLCGWYVAFATVQSKERRLLLNLLRVWNINEALPGYVIQS
jgi:hypothetical protein